MDTLNTLLLGWLVFGVLIFVVAKLLYDKYLSPHDQPIEDDDLNFNFPGGGGVGTKEIKDQPKAILDSQSQEAQEAQAAKDIEAEVKEALKKVKIVPKVAGKVHAPPNVTGGDPDAVRWANNVFVWMFSSGGEGGKILRETWNEALNEFTVGVALEAGVLVEILEFLPQIPPPLLRNTIVDCSPNDDMIITCDIQADLYFRVQTTRTQRDVTMESEYACAVKPLQARLSFTTSNPHIVFAARFDGWPEVSLELEGIRNNSSGLDEQQLQTVVNEVITAALRKVSLDLDFYDVKNYPNFSRARQLPDKIVPVGYDALIREQQTHPPSFTAKKPPPPRPVPHSRTEKRTPPSPPSPQFRRPISTSAYTAALLSPSSTFDEDDLDYKDSPLNYDICSSNHTQPNRKRCKEPERVERPITPTIEITCPPLPSVKPVQTSLKPSSALGSSAGSASGGPTLQRSNSDFMTSSSSDIPIIVNDPESKFTSPLDLNHSNPYQNLDICSYPSYEEEEALSSIQLTPSEESLIARNLKRYERESSMNGHGDTGDSIGKQSSSQGSSRPDSYGLEDDLHYVYPIDETRTDLAQNNNQNNRVQDVDSIEHNTSCDSGAFLPLSEQKISSRDFKLMVSDRQKPIDERKLMADGINIKKILPLTDVEEFEDDDDDPLKDLKKLKTPSNQNNQQFAPLSQNRGSFQQQGPPLGIVGLNGKRLLVKIVKACGIGAEKPVVSAHCVAEMDDPQQNFITVAIPGTTSPFWDEQFLFELSDNTLELLFEIYGPSKEFYGLGIVGIEELVATPSQRQIIPLQARPYEKDEVSGSLTCEFLFLDRADLPDLIAGRTKGDISRPTPIEDFHPVNDTQNKMASRANEAQPSNHVYDLNTRNQLPVIDIGNQQNIVQPYVVVGKHSSSRRFTDDEPYTSRLNDSPTGRGRSSKRSSNDRSSPNTLLFTAVARGGSSEGSLYSSKTSIPTPTPSTANVTTQAIGPDDPLDERGRSRKKLGFFGSMRKRFGRSKTRAQSVEPSNIHQKDSSTFKMDPLAGRSVSVERSTSMTKPNRGFLKVPAKLSSRSASTSAVSHAQQQQQYQGDDSSRRSSLSGTSGLSSASTKTYVNEASLMVVESLENNVVRHHLIPLSLQRSRRWRKKGTKLHIFNEHTFVAKHIPSATLCEICQKPLGKRIGKQGYECRDCSICCHKPCHVLLTGKPCPNTSVNTMDLIYVKDERAERRKGLTKIS